MAAPASTPAKYVMRKLPHVTVLFWILKITAVTLGETAGDLFGIDLKIGYGLTALIFFVFFLVVVFFQVRAKRFNAAIFWSVIMATSIVGTEISDGMDRGLFTHSGKVTASGIGYGPGAGILFAILALIFFVWWRTGQTYDVENIATRKGEILYWFAVLVSNTLGTASGDVLAHDTPLGFRNAFFVIAAVMLAILVCHYLSPINGTVLFWLAFILARPLGAAGGDSLTKPVSEGGAGWGTLWASVALLALLTALILYGTYRLRRHPLELLPAPLHRISGQPQRPNGELVMAYGPHPDQITQTAPRGSGLDGAQAVGDPDGHDG